MWMRLRGEVQEVEQAALLHVLPLGQLALPQSVPQLCVPRLCVLVVQFVAHCRIYRIYQRLPLDLPEVLKFFLGLSAVPHSPASLDSPSLSASFLGYLVSLGSSLSLLSLVRAVSIPSQVRMGLVGLGRWVDLVAALLASLEASLVASPGQALLGLGLELAERLEGLVLVDLDPAETLEAHVELVEAQEAQFEEGWVSQTPALLAANVAIFQWAPPS